MCLHVTDVKRCVNYSHIVTIEICISCGSTAVVASHPLFKGGLCKKCKVCVYVPVNIAVEFI